MTEMRVDQFCKIAALFPQVILLKNRTVVQWLMGDLSFLSTDAKFTTKKQSDLKYKELEDKWGQSILELRRPDLRKSGQWTTKFGEHICEEINIMFGKVPTSPRNIDGYKPDVEVDDAIWEAKTQTYMTDGTAGEKILGVPFKYADIPRLYGKPLKILCIGCAEKKSREQYGNIIGLKTTETKREFIEFYKSRGIEWVGFSDLIADIIYNSPE